MAILKTDKRSNDSKFIGANVVPHMHQYLTLYTLAKGTTKSHLFKVLLDRWLNEQRTAEPDDLLLKELIERIDEEWIRRKETSGSVSFHQYKLLVQKEMEDKGLKAGYVNLIMSKIQQ